MKTIINEVQKWLNNNHEIALATVVNTQGSSPREIGAVMAVNNDGKVIGSISGGCVEAALVEESLQVIKSGKPKLVSYGISDELGLSVGLTCGGTIEILIEKLTQSNIRLNQIIAALNNSEKTPVTICTVCGGENLGAKMIIAHNIPNIGTLGNKDIDRVVALDGEGFLEQGLTTIQHYGIKGEREQTDVSVFFQSFTTSPHLIIFGAVDFAQSLCHVGKILGYKVTICDARSRFATVERFPLADEVIVEWPHNYLQVTNIDDRSVIMVLTHDPKFDVPALMMAVKTNANYIGAMGSRKATKDRFQRLQEAGMTDTELVKISSPLGLDIGAKTPAETAISIMAEVIALKNGRKGGRLSQNYNPIHNIRGEK